MINIFSAFWIVRELLKAFSLDKQVDFLSLGPHIMLILLQYFITFVIVRPATTLTIEAERTEIFVGKFMIDSDSDFCTELQKFNSNKKFEHSKQFLQNQLECDFSGKFSKKNKINLLRSMFQTTSTIVTYLIITCQFDAPPALKY